MAKTQFPNRKIGIAVVWACLFLPLISIGESIMTLLNRNDHVLLREADPELVGPVNLCIVFGGVIGTFSGGGDPNTDVYTWQVIGPNGEIIFDRSGGNAQFETIKVSFNQTGDHTVTLSVRRNSFIFPTESMTVKVQQGPKLEILPDYLICGDTPAEITAINPDTPNIGQYNFVWTDNDGNVVGTTNSISVNQEGNYKVELYLSGNSGQQECLITGTTYVGPSLDFNLKISSESICQGQSIMAGLDRPISGEWFMIPPNSSQKTSLGVAYKVNLVTDSIPDAGVYTLIFSAPDPNYPDCNSERRINFEVLEGPKLNLSLIEQPDNCISNAGSFSIEALSSLDSLLIVETGFSATNIPQNQTFEIDFLEPQLYTIAAYSNGCENITIYNLETKNPPVNTPDVILPSIQVQDEICTENGVLPGSVQLVFNQGKVNGEYRLMSQRAGTILTDVLQNQDTLFIPLQGGTYLLELKIENCIYPIQGFTVATKPQVSFTKPNQIIICESFEFVPETSQDLIFTLKFPDQSVQTLLSGASFTLTQEGEYELLGESTNASSGLCPRLEKFTATISTPFSFGVSVYEEDCFGNQIFKADLAGIEPEETSIRWLNDQGEIVGRSELLYATSIGDFALVVQPLESGFCPIEPINFTIEAPILQAEVILEASKICPEPGTSQIKVITDTIGVKTISWIYFDDAGNRRNLPEFENIFQIMVDTPGNYEAVVYNRIGCEIGRNFTLVENSNLLTLPVVEELYGVCERGEKGPVIDPGDFAEYNWYYDEELVSTDSLFSPKEAGEYNLKVVTLDGCEFFTSFRTYDACSFSYVMPNAMVLGDPERNFEVRVSEGITEVELFIINRQGALVHYEKSEEIPYGEAFLKWDGTINGTPISTGTYVVVLVGRNPLYQFEDKITTSLLVIE